MNLFDNRQKGFTLVELSIVIVLIGLIVSGVIGGQKLVVAAKLKSQISEFRKVQVAHNSFKLEYGTVPGDLSNASSYWGGTPNGNGDGRVTSAADVAYSNNESKRYWRHLTQAKLFPGNYMGSGTLAVNITHPAMKLNDQFGMTAAGALTNNSGTGNETGPVYQLSPTNGKRKFKAAVWLNDARSSSGVTNHLFDDGDGTASPQTYSSIDGKMDDGVALTGLFRTYRARNSPHGNCLTAQDGDYLLTNAQLSCQAFYIVEK